MTLNTDSQRKYQDKVTVACINFTPVEGDKAASLAKIKNFTVRAAGQGANIVIFPELALDNIIVPSESELSSMLTENVPAPDSFFSLAETIPGPSTEELTELAAEHNVYIIIGLMEKDGDKYYNSAAVIGSEGVLGAHRKTHVRSLWEKAWMNTGTSLPIFETSYGPIGIGICFETYCMPEVARSYAARGARLFFNVTAHPTFPDCDDSEEFYMNMLRCRSSENQMFLASSNLVGGMGGTFEWDMIGRSLIMGPKPGYMNAQLLAGPASNTEEEIVIATLDLGDIEKVPFAVIGTVKERKPEVFLD